MSDILIEHNIMDVYMGKNIILCKVYSLNALLYRHIYMRLQSIVVFGFIGIYT